MDWLSQLSIQVGPQCTLALNAVLRHELERSYAVQTSTGWVLGLKVHHGVQTCPANDAEECSSGCGGPHIDH